MSDERRLTDLETVRVYCKSFPINAYPGKLLSHIDAIEAENATLRKQVEAADALLDEIQNTIDKGHLWTDRTKVGYIADALERHRATQEQEVRGE